MKPQEKIDSSTEWLGKLCHLYVAKTAERGYAPHKPLLLLCIMDMVEDRAITTRGFHIPRNSSFAFSAIGQ